MKLSISTHAPTRGATLADFEEFKAGQAFLLTPLREGRRSVHRANTAFPPNFYSRPYARGDPKHFNLLLRRYYFYSRPYARGDLRGYYRFLRSCNISTHAPTRGATVSFLNPASGFSISTHAPTRGATRRNAQFNDTRAEFLLTPLREGRLPHSTTSL